MVNMGSYAFKHTNSIIYHTKLTDQESHKTTCIFIKWTTLIILLLIMIIQVAISASMGQLTLQCQPKAKHGTPCRLFSVNNVYKYGMKDIYGSKPNSLFEKSTRGQNNSHEANECRKHSFC